MRAVAVAQFLGKRILAETIAQQQPRGEEPVGRADHAEIEQFIEKYQKKWNHAAAISLCKELRLDFPYGGHRVLVHLSR